MLLAAPMPSDTTVATPPQPTTLLSRLIGRCADPDPSTRKFACFAVGNAAFHGSLLYPHLDGSVPHLVAALRNNDDDDDHHDGGGTGRGGGDDKCRANAAGALGNLVRNSSELCGQLNAYGAAELLLDVATSDPSQAPRRIALFSLGTLAVYSTCRSALECLDNPPLLERLAAIERDTKALPTPDDQV